MGNQSDYRHFFSEAAKFLTRLETELKSGKGARFTFADEAGVAFSALESARSGNGNVSACAARYGAVMRRYKSFIIESLLLAAYPPEKRKKAGFLSVDAWLDQTFKQSLNVSKLAGFASKENSGVGRNGIEGRFIPAPTIGLLCGYLFEFTRDLLKERSPLAAVHGEDILGKLVGGLADPEVIAAYEETALEAAMQQTQPEKRRSGGRL